MSKDCKVGSTYRFTFTSALDGVPTVLAGSPVVSIYKDGSVTQSVAGVTLTASFDGVVGLNLVEIDFSADGTFYSAGADFSAVVTTGTINSVSVAGSVVDTFSIEKVPVNWALVTAPTTANALSSTSIATVATATNATNVANLSAGAIAAASFAAGAIDAAAIAANAIGTSEFAVALQQAIADVILARALAAESYAADGAVPTLSQILYALLQNVCEFSITGTTITVKKLDKATTAETFTLDSSTTPTSRTRAT